jgi:hypothetical protein
LDRSFIVYGRGCISKLELMEKKCYVCRRLVAPNTGYKHYGLPHEGYVTLCNWCGPDFTCKVCEGDTYGFGLFD